MSFRPDLVDEHRVRAAAGLAMAAGAIAFACAVLDANPTGIRIVSVVFATDFTVRVADRLEHSPVGIVAGWLVRWQPPQLVSTRPKRFAWSLGIAMSVTMAVATNLGVRGVLPRVICVICLVLMWAEAVLGLCIGCQLYGVLVRHGWIDRRAGFDVCADGACAVPCATESTDDGEERSNHARRDRHEASVAVFASGRDAE